jgi:hypothetical protein
MYLTGHLGPKNFTNLVRYSREFVITVIVITVIVITEFDDIGQICKKNQINFSLR